MHHNTDTEPDLPGEAAVQYGDEEALGSVEGREEISQEERWSRQEHQARRPCDALQEEQRQGAHCPSPGDTRVTFLHHSDELVKQKFTSAREFFIIFSWAAKLKLSYFTRQLKS